MNSPIQDSGKITYKVDKEYKVKVDSDCLLDCGKGLNCFIRMVFKAN